MRLHRGCTAKVAAEAARSLYGNTALVQQHAAAAMLILVLIHAARAMAPPRKYTGPGFRVVRCFPKLSRRDADKAVCDGRVTVNGRVAKPALRVKSSDVVTLDGRKQDWEPFAASLDENARRFVVYNKPAGVTCTTDNNDRRSLRFQPALKRYFSAGRVFPVGRLDADSEGLVLLTDDGTCADALLQPKSKVAKTYVVEFERDVDDGDVARLADGVEIETPQQRSGATTTQRTRPCEVSREGDKRLRFILSEGRNRQLRRMAEAVGHAVVRLERVAFGPLAVDGLERGAARELTASERAEVVSHVDAAASSSAARPRRRRRTSR